MGWLDTIGDVFGSIGQIGQGLGQVASPILSWYNYDQYKDALGDYQDALQQGTQQGLQSINQGIQSVQPFADIAKQGFGTAYDWIMDPTLYEKSPGVDWLREQGMQGIERSAAARGGLESGRTLKELSRYNQGLALQDYQNQINNLTQLAAYANLPTLASLYGDQASLGLYGNAAGGLSGLAGANAQSQFLNDLLGIAKGAGNQQVGGGNATSTLGGLANIGSGLSSIAKGGTGLWNILTGGGSAAEEATSGALSWMNTGGLDALRSATGGGTSMGSVGLGTAAGGTAAMSEAELGALADYFGGAFDASTFGSMPAYADLSSLAETGGATAATSGMSLPLWANPAIPAVGYVLGRALGLWGGAGPTKRESLVSSQTDILKSALSAEDWKKVQAAMAAQGDMKDPYAALMMSSINKKTIPQDLLNQLDIASYEAFDKPYMLDYYGKPMPDYEGMSDWVRAMALAPKEERVNVMKPYIEEIQQRSEASLDKLLSEHGLTTSEPNPEYYSKLLQNEPRIKQMLSNATSVTERQAFEKIAREAGMEHLIAETPWEAEEEENPEQITRHASFFAPFLAFSGA